MKYIFYLFCALCFVSTILSNTVSAQDKAVQNQRPVIGLVLSGGGARGASHVGVLKVLEELRIPVDIITGTSMGAVTGGLYAYGYSAEELEHLLSTADWEELFSDKPSRTQLNPRRKLDNQNLPIKYEMGFKNRSLQISTGLVEGQKLNIYLKSLTLSAPKIFSDMNINFRAVATDIETGEAVMLDQGSLATAMLASLSIPGVFAPVEWNGKLLVDGGIVNNLPIKLARELGAQVLIVVDLSGKLHKRNELTSPLSILNQSVEIQMRRSTLDQLDALALNDVLIQPQTAGYSSTDFNRSIELINRGVLAAQAKHSLLSRLSLSEEQYQQYLDGRQRKAITAPHIEKIVIDNQSSISSAVIESYIKTKAGQLLDYSILEQDIEKLYGLNIFKSVDYEIVEKSGSTQVIIKAKEKDWGPKYIRFGANVENNFDNNPTYTHLTMAYNVVPIGVSGSEWRTELELGNNDRFHTEFHQPLDNKLRYSIKPWASYYHTHLNYYIPSESEEDPTISYAQFGLSIERLFNNWGMLTYGVNVKTGDSRPNVGKLSIADDDVNTGAWEFGFTYDQLDSFDFPKSGLLSSVNWIGNRKNLGNDVNQERVRINLLWAESLGNNAFIFWTSIGGVVDGDIPENSGYAIGGLFSLSGLEKNSLVGEYAGIARLMYIRDFSGRQSLLKIPLYMGLSVETGNVWDDSSDISLGSLLLAGSLFIGLDTPIGPFYLAQGFSSGGKSESYLFLGRNLTFF